MNKTLSIVLITFIIVSINVSAQKKLAEFPFESHSMAMNVNTAISVSKIQIKVATPDVLTQTPVVVTDNDVNSLFFKFNASYSVANNNISFAIAPKPGNNVRIKHIEFRVRFGSSNSGNAGIFISKDPTFTTNTQVWSCGNNNTFNTYKDFVIEIPESTLSYSESTTDSIRFVFSQGTNTQGMYIDNFEIYGIVNNETNSIQSISVDASSISKELANHPSGANSCWLMDSDIKWARTVSNESRFAEMKLGALRYPYGHLADNYLWHTPGQYSTVDKTGPIPQIASSEVPASWTWAVNQTDGTFLKDLSFDEYMGICKRNGIEPLIVVNAQSYTYTGGPTYETLKTSATEWVRYANITKGYGIKYWQIGNEVEHNGNLTMSVYTNLFIDFATAMKAIDPTIKVGTGILSNTNWNKDVLTKAGTLCSFISTHNYQYSNAAAAGGFRTWYKDYSILTKNTNTSQKMLDANFADRPEIEIHVTETNVTGGDFPDISNIDIYKALYWFEMDMNQLAEKNVKYTYFWGTHSPWGGETSLGNIGTLLENSADNTIRPSGRIIQLINTYLKGKLITTTHTIGNLRIYASVSNDENEMSVFILNKNLYVEKANLNLSNFNATDAQIEQIIYKGLNYSDVAPVISTEQLFSIPTQIDLAPVSLTILHFTKSGNTAYPTIEDEKIKMYFDGENIHSQLSNVQDAKLNIYSANGQLVTSENIKNESNIFNVSLLNKGVYIAYVQSGEFMRTIKLIK